MQTLQKNDLLVSVILVTLALLVNIGGRYVALYLNVPMWLDCLGTVFCSFYLGLVHGVVCAVLTNVIISFMVPDNDLFYVIVSISVSLVTVRFARHVDFKKFTSAVNYTGLLVLVSALLSFIINLFLYGGMSGSEWGDAVIIFLQEQGLSHICYPVGQLYIEFSDKIFVGYALYLHFRFFYHGLLIEMQKREKEARNQKKLYETEVLGEDTKLGDEERTSGRFSSFLKGLRKPHSMLVILCVFGLTVQPYSAHAASESMPRSSLNKENPSIDLRTLNGKALKRENSDLISANKRFSTFSVSADNPSFLSLQQTVFSSKNGLNCGTANDIATTKDGYLWVGTYAGLYQYDGQKFSQRDDLKNIRTVRSLYTDTSDRLWIGTGGLGVAVYEKGGVVATFDVNDSLVSDYILDMVDDGNGDYYIATTSGLSVFRYVNGKFVFYRNFIKGRSVTSLYVLHDGMVAATSEHGSLYLFRGGEFIEEFRDDESTPRFYSIAEDMNGNIYLAGKDGIFLYHFYDQKLKKVGSFFNYELENINSIYWDKNGTEQVLFICADSGIFYLYNGKIRKLRTVGFDNSCERVIKDYQGNFWFTSSRLGLLELYRSQVENIFQGAGLEPTVVNCVIFWNNLLYVGTDSGIRIIDTVKRYDVETGFSNMLKGIRIRAFATDQHGNLVVCTYGKGAYIYDKNGRILRYQVSDGLFGNKVRTALTLNDDNLILAGNGITFIDKYGVLHTPLAEYTSLESFLCLTKFDENTVVGGTDGSGVVYIKDRKIEKRITKKDGLLSDVVLRVVKSKKYNLVYVLTGNGINTIDADYKVRSFEKFPYFNNYDLIQTAEGRLFITGSNGVYTCLESDLLSDDKELDYLHFGNSYGISSTLTSNSWNYLSENGMLYLCSSVGVFVLDTINFEVKSYPYKISIKELKLDDAVEPIVDSLPKVIARNVKKIQIMPEIVNFTREDPNICYYLAGFEDKKNYRRQSELFDISYTNVPPGTYSLNLEVLDANGMCIAKSTYPFTKASALWDTDLFLMYFYTIAFLMVAYVTWFFVRLFMQRTIDRQRHELELTEQLVRVGDETILTIAMALDARDKRTQLHSKRVSEYSVFIARELGFSEKECENLRKVALLHDIGKIGIPDRILNKPDRLTDEEFKIMRSHVTIGYEILKNFRSIAHVTDGIRYHHERYDGKGYVLGLKGEEIPIYGRIIAVADAFDAMASNRIYRQHLDIKEILLEIEKCKGKQFDPQCADIMIRLIRNGTIDLGKFYGEQYITGRPEGIVENAGNIYS